MSHAFHLTSPGQLRRDARIIGLLFASTTSIIGSGWLFGSFHAAKIAGPLSIWSWIVGSPSRSGASSSWSSPSGLTAEMMTKMELTV